MKPQPKHRKLLLEQWVWQYGWSRGAELGVFAGNTYLHLLNKCPRLILIGVDIWTPQPEKELMRPQGGRSYESFDLTAFERDVRKRAAQFGARAVLIKDTTVNAALSVADGSLDFIFADADHTYEGILSDILAWRPKIKPHGMFCGHDYNPKDFPGIVRAVDEQFPQRTLHGDTVWAATV